MMLPAGQGLSITCLARAAAHDDVRVRCGRRSDRAAITRWPATYGRPAADAGTRIANSGVFPQGTTHSGRAASRGCPRWFIMPPRWPGARSDGQHREQRVRGEGAPRRAGDDGAVTFELAHRLLPRSVRCRHVTWQTYRCFGSVTKASPCHLPSETVTSRADDRSPARAYRGLASGFALTAGGEASPAVSSG
jgi:hypothetical protein